MNFTTSTFNSPYIKINGLSLNENKWTGGFWGDRFELCYKTILPNMLKALEEQENKAKLIYFRIASKIEEGKHEGTNWSDGDCYKWIEAMSSVYGITKSLEIDQTLDEVISWIAGAQEKDGYLNTQITLDPNKYRWQDINNHELYNMGHCFTAAVVHFEATGKKNFLQIAIKLAEYLCGIFIPTPKNLANFGFNPSQIVGLIDLYRITGNKRYLELANVFVSNRGSEPNPGVNGDQNQDRIPLRSEKIAVGHAVTATYLWSGAADVYAETGEDEILQALKSIWDDVVSNKLYITGAVGAQHFSASIRRDPVHEAFGFPYDLPNARAYNETCANIGQAMWAQRMLGLTGDSKYADVMEQIIYNSGLSGMSIDGTKFCYTNPLRWHGKNHQIISNDTPERWFIHSCYCCPPQVARTIAKMNRWAYGKSVNAVWVHIFGSNRLETEVSEGSLVLEQQTDYPWDGNIKIVIQRAPSNPFTLNLRIPAWAQNAEMNINEENIEVIPGTYVSVNRKWEAGDILTILIPMETELVSSNPKLEQNINQVAVVRGPLVYCLEEIDLEKDVNLEQIFIPRNFSPKVIYKKNILGGINILEGKGLRAKGQVCSKKLYNRGLTFETASTNIQMIPYFSWHNRGNCEMAVWLPTA